MQRFESKINAGSVVAIVGQLSDFSENRVDICDIDDPIQFSIRKLAAGFEVQPHKHLSVDLCTTKRMEVWILLKGKLEYEIFDTNDELLVKSNLHGPSFIVFFDGGHSLRCIEDDSFFFEIKTGPYKGVENDKKHFARQVSN